MEEEKGIEIGELNYHPNENGWGPPSSFILKEFEGIPFAPFTKSEKYIKFCDISAVARYNTYGGSGKYGQRFRPAVNPELLKEQDRTFATTEGKAGIGKKTNREFGGGPPVRKQPMFYYPPRMYQNWYIYIYNIYMHSLIESKIYIYIGEEEEEEGEEEGEEGEGGAICRISDKCKGTQVFR